MRGDEAELGAEAGEVVLSVLIAAGHGKAEIA